MPNDRLRSAMKAHRVTVAQVAEQLNVDDKSVERWLQGRVPHSRHRWALSELLSQDEDVLWPDARRALPAGRTSELVRVYAHRSDVPAEVWSTFLTTAEKEIGVLAYAALFLPEQASTVDLLAAKAAQGCRVRILLADPGCPKLEDRGTEERFGEGIISRVRVALRHYEPITRAPGAEVRLHCTTLYNSIFRFDDALMVNTHVWGLNAFASPVLQLQRAERGGLFDSYSSSFDTVWDAAKPADFTTVHEERT